MSDPGATSSGTVEPTRRGVLDVLLGATLLGAIGSALYPVLRYLKPLPAAGPSGPVRLTRTEVESLEAKRFVIVPVAATRVLVFRDAALKLHALDARCTHEGCTVQFVSAEAVIWCACHNGRFALDGRVISGPPPKPLQRYAVREEADGSVFVTPEHA